MSSQELLQGFIAEASDLLDEVEPALINYPKITDASERSEVVNRVFRHFHSIKGSAGFMGLDDISKLTHEAETLLDQYHKNPGRIIPQGTINLLCNTVDFLRLMFAHQTGDAVHDDSHPIELETLIRTISEATKAAKGEPKPGQTHHDAGAQPNAAQKHASYQGKGSGTTKVKKSGMTKVKGSNAPQSAVSLDTRISAPGGGAPAKQTDAKPAAPRKSGSDMARKPSSTAVSSLTSPKQSHTITVVHTTDRESIEKLSKTEFLTRYVSEANELLEQTEQAFLQAEQQPELGNEAIREALRCLHSFKGNSGFMNLKDLERLSHRMETEVEYTVGKAIGFDVQALDVLLQMLDVLRQGVLDISYGGSGNIPEVDSYIAMMDEANAEAKPGTGARTRGTDTAPAAPAPPKPQPDPGGGNAERQDSAAGSGSSLENTTPAVNNAASTKIVPFGKASQQENLSEYQRSARIIIKDDEAPRAEPPVIDKKPSVAAQPASPPKEKSRFFLRAGGGPFVNFNIQTRA